MPGQENLSVLDKLMVVHCEQLWEIYSSRIQSYRVLHTFVNSTSRSVYRSSQWISEKYPHILLLGGSGGRKGNFKICQSFLFLKYVCPQEKLVNYSLICWGFIRGNMIREKRNTQLLALFILSHRRGEMFNSRPL